MARGTRPRKYRVDVWCNADEFALIKATAQATKLSNSGFLRAVGTGYQPRSTFDGEVIDKLARLHADQGCLGGLLKLWLSEKKNCGAPAYDVRVLLRKVEDAQALIAKLVEQAARRL